MRGFFKGITSGLTRSNSNSPDGFVRDFGRSNSSTPPPSPSPTREIERPIPRAASPPPVPTLPPLTAVESNLVHNASSTFALSVQQIVLSAREVGSSSNWKTRLIKLIDEGVEELSAYKGRPRFNQKCVETDLPPNLVHCLRLLRVIEMQGSTPETSTENATLQITSLLTSLCADTSVGEVLRPHLFGLFALPGASYPSSSTHIPLSASNVIKTISQNCLSRSLVFYLHDRRVVHHMVEDIKELIKYPIDESSPPVSPKSGSTIETLTGEEAEKEGLWIIALSSLISLMSNSTPHDSDCHLLNDFSTSSGYDVLTYAIKNSTGKNAAASLELLSKLISMNSSSEAKNEEALGVLAKLARGCTPMLEGKRTSYDRAREASKIAMRRFQGEDEDDDKVVKNNEPFCTEILILTLNLFSNNSANYASIEPKYGILELFLTAYPTFTDPSLKIFVLKTLEFVCTGISNVSPGPSLQVAMEVFVAANLTVLADAAEGSDDDDSEEEESTPRKSLQNRTIHNPLTIDVQMITTTILKLLEFDSGFSVLLIQQNFLDQYIYQIFSKISIGATSGARHNLLDAVAPSVLGVMNQLLRHRKGADIFCELFFASLLQQPIKFLKQEVATLALTSLEEVAISINSKDNNSPSSPRATAPNQAPAATANPQLDTIVSSLIELCHSLMQSKSGSHQKRQWHVYQTLVNITLSVPSSTTMFLSNSGFEAGMCSLARLASTFSTTATHDDDFTVLSSTLHLFAAVMSSDLNARSYFNTNITYANLASTIEATGIFENPTLATPAMTIIFDMVIKPVDPKSVYSPQSPASYEEKFQALVDAPPHPPPQLSNADAIKILFHLTPHITSQLAHSTLAILIKLTSSPQIHQSLSSANLVHTLTNDFDHILSSPTHPLQKFFFKILNNLSSSHMTCADFKSLMTCIASPCLADSNGKLELPIIWSSTEPHQEPSLVSHRVENAEKFTSRLDNLCEIAASSDSVPYTTLGSIPPSPAFPPNPLASEFVSSDSSYLHIESLCRPASSRISRNPLEKQREQVTAFPSSSGFSFSCWLSTPTLLTPTSPPLPILTISSGSEHVSLTYDKNSFNVTTSTTPTTPLTANPTPLKTQTWHHISFSYTPPKRLLSKKATVSIHVDALSSPETTIYNVQFPSLESTQCFLGYPHPASHETAETSSKFYLGPCIFTNAALSTLDVTCMFVSGPSCTSPHWGEEPLLQSLPAIRTNLLHRLHEIAPNITQALAQRSISRMNFKTLQLPYDDLIFAFNAHAAAPNKQTLHNVASLSSICASSASICWNNMLTAPRNFAENAHRVGSSVIFLPLVSASQTTSMIASALRLIGATLKNHVANREAMQAGQGYKMLALLLRQKKHLLDQTVLNECFSIAIAKFDPSDLSQNADFLFADWDALKFLLLNHQVWDVKNPSTLLSQLAALNSLVSTSCRNCSFNARGLYHVQIVDWAVHLMVEAISMYNSTNNKWHITPPSIALAAIGADSQDDFLLSCKTLLKRILSNYLDKKKDLQHIAETLVYTLTVHNTNITNNNTNFTSKTLTPAGLVRVYLLRLLLELVLEGVEHLEKTTAASSPTSDSGSNKLTDMFRNKRRSTTTTQQPGSEARLFLEAFASTLTPTWFVCMLEGCDDAASSSLTFRLLTLLLQSCPTFAAKFSVTGGFKTLVMSVPKFSTSPCIILPMLATLLNIKIHRLPYLPSLDPDQLIVLFDSVIDDTIDSTLLKYQTTGLCNLLSECVGRNIQLSSSSNPDVDEEEMALAKHNNNAILKLLAHVHSSSNLAYSHFKQFSREMEFLEPLAQALFVCSDVVEKASMPPGRRVYSESTGGKLDLTSKIEEDYVPASAAPSKVNRKASFERRVSASKTLIAHRKGSTITQRNISDDVGERFAGEEGKNILDLLSLVIHNAFVEDSRAETLQTLIQAFPAHATDEQVFSYYDVILHSLNETLTNLGSSLDDAQTLTNLVTFGTCLLTNILSGLFAHDAVYDALVFTVEALKICQSTKANRTLGTEKQNQLVSSAVRIAQNTAIAVLRRCDQHWGPDLGPDVEQVTSLVVENLQLLLMRLNMSGSAKVQTDINGFASSVLNLDSATADKIFTVCLLSVQLPLLNDSSTVQQNACTTIATLLTVRKGLCMEMFNLGASLNGDDGNALGIKIQENEIYNGFSLLLNTAARRNSNVGAVLGKNAAFFEWLTDNSSGIELTFDLIREMSEKYFPDKPMNPSNFILQLQKEKVSSMGGGRHQHSDIMFKGIERGERVAIAEQNTIDNHDVWKKRGFDDLTSGAMEWKKFLRQVKGELGVWERNMEEEKVRWKLDLSEGPERTRKKMLRNWEFYEVYNVEEEEKEEGSTDKNNLKRSGSKSELHILPGLQVESSGSVEATAEIVKMMNLKAGKSKKNVSGEEEEYGGEEGVEVINGQEDDDESSVASSNVDKSLSPSPEQQPRVRLDSELSEEEEEEDGEGGREDEDPSKTKTKKAGDGAENESKEDEEVVEETKASTFELLRGLVQPNDLPDKRSSTAKVCYNVSRCTGLEVKKTLLLCCKRSVYFIDGFELTEGDGLEGTIERVAEEESKFDVQLRRASSIDMSGALPESDTKGGDTGKRASKRNSRFPAPTQPLDAGHLDSAEKGKDSVTFQHRCQRIPFDEIYAVYKRRYQLRQIALEFFDSNHSSILVAFATCQDRDNLLQHILKTPLPNSVFNSNKQMLASGSGINYKKFMGSLRSKITNRWCAGRMSNFEYLMFLNMFAGRTYNDLTQYPVFPWVLSDYTSEEIDLNDPSVYRDLSKPMGALGESRAEQFRERFEALAAYSNGVDDPPPFHYGTHYSCSGYVLYYLMRLEPYSRLALALQGGRFDKADRLFRSVSSSWRSASEENLQDVRELIPEFFYLPEFLSNSNYFDFGNTQAGVPVHDVELPPWAKGDPQKFVMINRMALESEHVSKNLHKWIDLIFGYKQRGREAVAAQNTYVHLSYEGNVDVDSITDPLEREATIAQIHNFGQTPSRLERKPHPSRAVPQAVEFKEGGVIDVDFGAINHLAALTPPLMIVGAPHRSYLRTIEWGVVKIGNDTIRGDRSVGDITMVKNNVVSVGAGCYLLPPHYMKYVRFGGPTFGLSLHVSVVTPRHRELDRCVAVHDNLHLDYVTCVGATSNGGIIVTGCRDSTIRVWKASKNVHSRHIHLKATLVGHSSPITAVHVISTYGLIVSGDAQGRVILWDLKRLCFLRCLLPGSDEEVGNLGRMNGVTAVSGNCNTGNICVLVNGEMFMFEVNGKIVARQGTGGVGGGVGEGGGGEGGTFKTPVMKRSKSASNFPLATMLTSTNCPSWMTLGVVAVTGHTNGDVILWGVDWNINEFVPLHYVPDRVHSCEITSLKVLGKTYFSGGGIGGGASGGGGAGGGGGGGGGGASGAVGAASGAVLGGLGVGNGGIVEDCLLVGDRSGKTSLCKVLRLDSLSNNDLAEIMRVGERRLEGVGGGVFGHGGGSEGRQEF
ncbi:hypothetical protein TrST_g7911 [Triparma strigata]|uniref:Uncharacterized protein n=1 Tax=Triparma strigata TaxID=1606541 RepID=A0A9W7B389_9STRA|nr:hypothetical protein TrST_g7911 [Triparma strigata]